MTIRATRVLLLRNLLRAADQRHLARILDRLDATELSALLLEVDDFERRRAASVLLGAGRLGETIEALDDAALKTLLYCARDTDASAALAAVPPKRAASLLMGLPAARREHLVAILDEDVADEVVRALPRGARPGKDSMLSVLRLRRLFA